MPSKLLKSSSTEVLGRLPLVSFELQTREQKLLIMEHIEHIFGIWEISEMLRFRKKYKDHHP